MENSNKIIPPHLNAEVYRTDATGTNSMLYLDYIRCHKDGTLLIGCSELTGRYWNGGASIFETVEQGQKLHNEITKSVNLTSGTPDGCFIEHSNKVLLCEDSGCVSIWSNHDNAWLYWYEVSSIHEHDDAVMSVDCLKSANEYVTAGADGNVKVWDINEMICIRNYRLVHNLPIYGVAVRPQSHTTFATASLDMTISLWDENTERSALDLVNNDCGIYCLEWMDENRLLFGDEAGVLRLVDTRYPEQISLLNKFPAPVHKIAVQPEWLLVHINMRVLERIQMVRKIRVIQSGPPIAINIDKTSNFAVACDNRIVSVFNIDEDNNPKLVYSDRQSHSNFVRGLAWDHKDNNVLHTSGWDGEIKTHKIE